MQAKESEFQTLVPCANLIKMKTHFQFILMNWNITSSKWSERTYLRDRQFKRNIQVMDLISVVQFLINIYIYNMQRHLRQKDKKINVDKTTYILTRPSYWDQD